jgi:SAM-dependent methyltransferase
MMTPARTAELDRYTRERDAHNKIFSEHTRKSADKFYTIIHDSRAIYEQLLRSRAPQGTALEYGCGMGSHSQYIARHGAARVVGIDISDVAIAKARDEAAAAGMTTVEHRRMNAESLEFDDNSFDLICGTAILHHLDLERAYSEIARVLRPGGLAAFMEPLGHNPLINLYRRLTPTLRTVDEHPLMMRDVTLARRYFSAVVPRYYVLQTLAAVPFHGSRYFRSVLSVLEASDAALFRVLPFTRRYAWQVVVALEKPIKASTLKS